MVFTTYVVHQDTGDPLIESVYRGPSRKEAHRRAHQWAQRDGIKTVSILSHVGELHAQPLLER